MATNFLDALMGMQGWEQFLGQKKPGLEQQLLGQSQGRGSDWVGWMLSRGGGNAAGTSMLDSWQNYPKMIRDRQQAETDNFNKAVSSAANSAVEKFKATLPKPPAVSTDTLVVGPEPSAGHTAEPAPTPTATPAATPTPKPRATGQTMSVASLELDDIAEIGRQLGLSDDNIRVAQAIAQTEGALGGEVGDQGDSYGPYQFHRRGMLPAYAASLGLDADEAAEYARQNPIDAVEWALQGYLGKAIKDGAALGLRGEALAEYVQRHGQRSKEPQRARLSYRGLFGGR